MIVISNGMLRSGSTLQYNLAAGVLETAGPLKRAGFLGDFATHEARAKLDALKAADSWSILKTHEAPLERQFYDERVRVLFSYRDVRDIAASIRKKWGYSFEHIVAQIDAMIAIERACSSLPNVLVQDYEKLYLNPREAAKQIATFLNLSLNDVDSVRIAAENSTAVDAQARRGRGNLLERMSDKLFGRGYNRKTLLHPDHISATAGKAGDWVNLFSVSEIASLNRRFGVWLESHNYALQAQVSE